MADVGLKHASTGDITGQEVGGALHSVKAEAERRRQGSREHRLAGAGDVFDEHVPTGEKGRDDELHLRPLSDQNAAHIVDQPGSRRLGFECARSRTAFKPMRAPERWSARPDHATGGAQPSTVIVPVMPIPTWMSQTYEKTPEVSKVTS